MTPAEINGRMNAYHAQSMQIMERNDTLAWMIGSYAARAYHEPKKYPRTPVFTIKKQEKAMKDSDMQAVMRNFADRHNREVSANGNNP